MSETSPALQLPLIQPSQAQKHVTHNEALRILDAVTQLTVESADLATPPADPAPGARYIVSAPGQAAWAGQDNAIALYAGAQWEFYLPQTGWRADVAPTGAALRFDGTAWQSAGLPDSLPQLGLNTSPDATNRLAVAADATLLTHDGAGHQLKINKDSAANTASLLFQTGWSGRAEMGTTGSDDFAIKVSADGANFLTAMTVSAATGEVQFPQMGAPRERLTEHRFYYVRLDGNDANSGISNTAAGAFRTLQHAVDQLYMLDCGQFNVTIEIAPGDYDEVVTLSGPVVGSGTYMLRGDTSDPSQVKTQRITCRLGANIRLEGIEFTSANGLTVLSAASVKINHLRFVGSGTGMSIRHAFVDATYAQLSFGSNVTSIATMYNYAYLSGYGANFYLESGIDWGGSGAFYMQSFCLTWLQNAQFSGDISGTVGHRYSLGIFSTINTANAGANLIPGSTAGVLAHNSLYI